MGGAILDSLMFGVEAVISLEVESVEGIQGTGPQISLGYISYYVIMYFLQRSTSSSVSLLHCYRIPSVVVLLVVVVLVREFAPAPSAVVVLVLVHPVPCCWWRTLESRTLASRRWAERAATRVAALAECAKEADLPSVDLCLRRRMLLHPLHLDDEDRVTLAVLPSFRDDDE